MRPLIGISGPDRGGGAAWLFTALNILLAGGKPVRIRPSRPGKWMEIDGLVLGGGSDIDSRAWTQRGFIDQYLDQTLMDKHKTHFQRIVSFLGKLYYPFVFIIRKILSRKSGTGVSPERDRLEFRLLELAARENKPVLGICRGAQLINVFFEGSLHEDIRSFYYEVPNPYSLFPVKTIYVEKNSKTGKILQTSELRVNALHHQAVNKEGKHILAVAREANGIIQAIEHRHFEFMIGVQWHPEYLITRKRQRRLFRSFVASTRKS